MTATVLNQLPMTFDTHRVERRVLRLFPIEFAEELLEFRHADDPLLRFSAAFSQWIGNTFHREIRKSSNRKVRTANLGGKKSDNQGWTKVNPGIPIV
jgi:hypothetical protein